MLANAMTGQIKDTLELIKQFSTDKVRPDNSHYRALLLKDAQRIAKIAGNSLFEVEKTCLSNNIVPERFSRNQKSLSTSDQLKLHLASVVVVGLGGLGSTVIEILARIGVGRLTLVDGDEFDESNLNRQLLSSPLNLGHPKATVADKRVRELNPAIRTKPVNEYLTPENSSSLLADATLAIDCLDSISDRFVLEQGCNSAGIPLVTAALAGTSGQATVIYPGDAHLEAIYGKRDKVPERGVEASLGTLPFTAVHMASIECAEAINLLLGKESTLRNKLFFTDICDHSGEMIELS